jgi:hypothetical protein
VTLTNVLSPSIKTMTYGAAVCRITKVPYREASQRIELLVELSSFSPMAFRIEMQDIHFFLQSETLFFA